MILRFVQDYFLILFGIIPFIGSLLLLCLNSYNVSLVKRCALYTSIVVFIISCFLFLNINVFRTNYQFLYHHDFLDFFNIFFSLGVDSVSILFIVLTTFLFVLCILSSWTVINYNLKFYLISFLITEAFLIFVFSALDILLFYIFFESILIPMFFIIGVWGSRGRRIHATYQFFLYTLAGSLLMLISIIFIHVQAGTTDLQFLTNCYNFSLYRQIYLWLAFFASFAVKIPMFPFHIWLPEAHVEAPTAGSVLLAGVLLKLGSYGFLRFSIPLFLNATIYFIPFIYSLCIIAIIYGSFTTIRQIDLK